MIPLVIWNWPETAILIGITIAVGTVLQIVVLWSIERLTDAALNRQQAHQSWTGRAVRVLAHATGLQTDRQAQRTATLGSMLRSLSGAAIWVTVLFTDLTILGVPLTPFLASAGIGGVALAFGAQSLVKDYITGIFMIVEDQYGVGDTITIGDLTGTVEEISLRVTRIQDRDGKVWYLRNGEITRVGNVTQGTSNAVVAVEVDVDNHLPDVTRVLEEVCAAIAADPAWDDALIEPPKLLGVSSIKGRTMTLSILLKCHPNKQFGVQRAILAAAQEALVAGGVKAAPPTSA